MAGEVTTQPGMYLPMSDFHKAILVHNHDLLVNDLDPADILDDLIQDGVIDDENRQRILAPVVRQDRVQQLLDILPVLGDVAYHSFSAALRVPYQHLFLALMRNPEEMVITKQFVPSPIASDLDLKVQASVNQLMDTDEGQGRDIKDVEMDIEADIQSIMQNAIKKLSNVVGGHMTSHDLQTCGELRMLMDFLLSKRKEITNLFTGSVIIRMSFNSIHGLSDLWKQYENGKLIHMFEAAFLTEEFKKKHHVSDVTLTLTINRKEYLVAKQELSERVDEQLIENIKARGNKDLTQNPLKTEEDKNLLTQLKAKVKSLEESVDELKVEKLELLETLQDTRRHKRSLTHPFHSDKIGIHEIESSLEGLSLSPTGTPGSSPVQRRSSGIMMMVKRPSGSHPRGYRMITKKREFKTFHGRIRGNTLCGNRSFELKTIVVTTP